VKEDHNSVANGRFHCLVALEKLHCMVANGRRRRNTFSPFHIFPLSPQQILLKLSIFSFDFKVLLYHGFRSLFTHFLSFPWPINYDHAFQWNKSYAHSLPIWFWLKISFPLLEIMVLCMAMSYGPHATQMNE
jgi:hypothetical protein